jgi:hypothetical protein
MKGKNQKEMQKGTHTKQKYKQTHHNSTNRKIDKHHNRQTLRNIERLKQ